MTTFADHIATAVRVHVDEPWRDRAACKGQGRVMDPPREQIQAARALGAERALWLKAKRLCWQCDVSDECLRWALSLPAREAHIGVCGGLTYEERLRLRRRQGALAALKKKESA
ncbi:hypothetical protein E1264_17930 [Actinomadura sp. KC216]|uniref:WhiB family transcriptional regulator n=1 Tax=Actinomadura sp. KC216 TaxID=2530370 RepID=UPI00104649E9|nr:WhiB family transcriptional regulator [Actinomadura sp. KC216]TDB86477.1 hypothetical protein E1264_17930 [Actinomadura sp. KC216]